MGTSNPRRRDEAAGVVPVVVASIVTALIVGGAWVGIDRRPQKAISGPRLADDGPNSSNVRTTYQQDYSFTVDWFSWDRAVWEQALASYRGQANLRYLEVGLYEGRSLLWMLENILTHPTARVTGIDPFVGTGTEEVQKRYFANLDKSGFAEKVTTIVGYSQVELRKLPLHSFDIIYIDGSHFADAVLEDAVLSARLLRPGGLLIFDDYLWELDEPESDRPFLALNMFHGLYGDQFDVVHSGWQLILKRLDSESG